MKILALAFFFFAAVPSFAQTCDSAQASVLDRDPFPFGKETPFPWRNIEGTWVGYDSKCQPTYFSIRKVQKTSTSVPLLRIVNFSKNSCEVFYRGLGIGQGRVVTAKMNSIQQNPVDLRIHNFRESSLAGNSPNRPPSNGSSIVTVMTLSDPAFPTVQVNLRMQKLGNDPAYYCDVQ